MVVLNVHLSKLKQEAVIYSTQEYRQISRLATEEIWSVLDLPGIFWIRRCHPDWSKYLRRYLESADYLTPFTPPPMAVQLIHESRVVYLAAGWVVRDWFDFDCFMQIASNQPRTLLEFIRQFNELSAEASMTADMATVLVLTDGVGAVSEKLETSTTSVQCTDTLDSDGTVPVDEDIESSTLNALPFGAIDGSGDVGIFSLEELMKLQLNPNDLLKALLDDQEYIDVPCLELSEAEVPVEDDQVEVIETSELVSLEFTVGEVIQDIAVDEEDFTIDVVSQSVKLPLNQLDDRHEFFSGILEKDLDSVSVDALTLYPTDGLQSVSDGYEHSDYHKDYGPAEKGFVDDLRLTSRAFDPGIDGDSATLTYEFIDGFDCGC